MKPVLCKSDVLWDVASDTMDVKPNRVSLLAGLTFILV